MKSRTIKTLSLGMLTSMILALVAWMRLTPSLAFGSSTNQTSSWNPWPANVRKELEAESKRSFVAEKEARKLLKEGHLNEAEKACYRALSLCPKINGEPSSIAAKELLGDIYQAQGRYKEAVEAYQASCKHTFANDHEETDLKIAWCYFKAGDLKNARKFYTEKKFWSVERFLGGTTPQQKADDLSMLPADKTPKEMEASLLYTLAAERNLHGYPEEANALYKKTLELAPRNALAARYIAWNLDASGKRDEAIPYWARAAAFGKGYIAEQGRVALNDHLMRDKVPQAIAEAQKIK